mmetsp:Transcript_53491/g.124516  ORF Transcript_53491/g.124516 Transcript_53491/m.124516 type:complete len:315 (+) Transcript_53491:52-996(+)|eukprot:CAMPEP_0171095784 /NCGR_PEP_ID=MMETSP0766_2-20121228/43369_1 /TAXON_ID=439317 /ORGANISM="Gambierdiscus australes, Strain CAWD 149" /LENGTH=314 /DNA_ID=CAMNT_0011554641 /DNA_START=51 /DNA_END=995 /DNA_ORIENTATION=+
MAMQLWQVLLAFTCVGMGAAEEACRGNCNDDRVLLYQLRVHEDTVPVIAQSGRGQEGEFDGIHFSTQKLEPDSVNVTLRLAAGKSIDITVNCSEFSVFIDGHGSTLTTADKSRLQTLVARLPQSADPVFPKIKRSPEDPPQKAETCDASAALRQSAIFLSEGPTNFHIKAKHTENNIVCLKSAEPAQAKWSDQKGKHKCKLVVGAKLKSKTPLQGDYGCMGRCGEGCEPASKKQVYTQGCLDHDMCSWHNSATGGPLDSNCGDEWMAASDDFMFGDFCAFTYDDGASKPIKEVEIPDGKVHVEEDNTVTPMSRG